ncbi:PRC-barrel domain-containing protein [Loktanella sp. S4079]|uniref:PRC-barrel domain-containing protein n=1 Tax=Loktanella sp. S4079 TaxID=579483 RepID=UPI0006990BEC|nr:PRC-barrel domain-containing protein [Loktanella sp. S4079]
MKRMMTTTALTLLVGTAGFAQSDLNTSADAEITAQADGSTVSMEHDLNADAETTLFDDAGNALAEAGESIKSGAEATGNAIANAADKVGAEADAFIAETNETLTSPMIENGSMISAQADVMVAGDLEGAVVYDETDAEIGEVSEIILSADGTAEKAVIDVGGFIGIGEKSVAVPFEELALLKTEADGEIFVYVAATKEELEAMPEFEAS